MKQNLIAIHKKLESILQELEDLKQYNRKDKKVKLLALQATQDQINLGLAELETIIK